MFRLAPDRDVRSLHFPEVSDSKRARGSALEDLRNIRYISLFFTNPPKLGGPLFHFQELKKNNTCQMTPFLMQRPADSLRRCPLSRSWTSMWLASAIRASFSFQITDALKDGCFFCVCFLGSPKKQGQILVAVGMTLVGVGFGCFSRIITRVLISQGTCFFILSLARIAQS